MKGTSNVPLILGIIGAVLMLPGLICAVICGGAVDTLAAYGGTITGASISAWVFGGTPIVTGIIGGVKGKTGPTLSFILLLVSTVLAGVGWYLTAFSSLFHLGALICFLIGAIIAKVQKMEG